MVVCCSGLNVLTEGVAEWWLPPSFPAAGISPSGSGVRSNNPAKTRRQTGPRGGRPRIARVGTLKWASKDGGRLALPDRVTLYGEGSPVLVELLADHFLSSPKREGRTDLSLIPSIPQTGIAKEAEKLCIKFYPRWLQNHCYRTYAIGAFLGRALPSFDPEVLFVASMLHDVGLTDAFKQGSGRNLVPGYDQMDAPCFAVRGAGVAQSHVTHHGGSQASSEAVAEAIALHLNVRVPRSRGVEAHLLNAGTAFDVIRLRSRKIPQDLIREIESRWPRENGFCDDILATWKRESRIHPDCRVAFLNRWPFSFERRISRKCPST